MYFDTHQSSSGSPSECLATKKSIRKAFCVSLYQGIGEVLCGSQYQWQAATASVYSYCIRVSYDTRYRR